jgi:hypothetical protein
MQPTYVSMYFPAQGLLLAAGKVLTGNAWYGLLFASALMCAALCWMLQAWLPARWALLGGLLAVLRLGLFSYWVNTYSGGGVLAALAGALVLGALPRLMKTRRLRYGLVLAAGFGLLLLTRPYEGMLLSLPVVFVIGRWMTGVRRTMGTTRLVQLTAAPLTLVIAVAAWMAYYNHQAFGKATTPPYSVNRSTYAVAPYYVWQSQRPAPVYHHAVMQHFYEHEELDQFKRIHSWRGFVPWTLVKGLGALNFFAGMALLPLLPMLRRALLDRRMRFLTYCLVVMLAGMLIQNYFIPHYAAPFTAVIYALVLQCMRHLRLWNAGSAADGKRAPAGTTIVRALVTVCLLMGVLRAFAAPLHFALPEWPVSNWDMTWYGPNGFGAERAGVAQKLERLPGRQLVVVRYGAQHNPYNEWVYNAADIDHAKVIWAREMGAASDEELLRFYKDRTVWLVQPDVPGAPLVPYNGVEAPGSALRASFTEQSQ